MSQLRLKNFDSFLESLLTLHEHTIVECGPVQWVYGGNYQDLPECQGIYFLAWCPPITGELAAGRYRTLEYVGISSNLKYRFCGDGRESDQQTVFQHHAVSDIQYSYRSQNANHLFVYYYAMSALTWAELMTYEKAVIGMLQPHRNKHSRKWLLHADVNQQTEVHQLIDMNKLVDGWDLCDIEIDTTTLERLRREVPGASDEDKIVRCLQALEELPILKAKLLIPMDQLPNSELAGKRPGYAAERIRRSVLAIQRYNEQHELADQIEINAGSLRALAAASPSAVGAYVTEHASELAAYAAAMNHPGSAGKQNRGKNIAALVPMRWNRSVVLEG